jgi:hypothetical protein
MSSQASDKLIFGVPKDKRIGRKKGIQLPSQVEGQAHLLSARFEPLSREQQPQLLHLWHTR